MCELLGDIFRTAIQAIIALTVPILIGYLGRYLASLTKSETAERCIMEVADAVTTAVLYVNQTYVDEMRKTNAFNSANQRYAMQLASENANDILEELRLSYNKLRQQNITAELLDIIGGSFA